LTHSSVAQTRFIVFVHTTAAEKYAAKSVSEQHTGEKIMFAAKSVLKSVVSFASLSTLAFASNALAAAPGMGFPSESERPRMCSMNAGYVHHPVTGKVVAFFNGCHLADLRKQGYVYGVPSSDPVVGTLMSVMAIGAETTGTALVLADGSHVELDLAANGFDSSFVEGAEVTIQGISVQVTGIEIPVRSVLVVTSLIAK
jgi:hypothetical protein